MSLFVCTKPLPKPIRSLLSYFCFLFHFQFFLFRILYSVAICSHEVFDDKNEASSSYFFLNSFLKSFCGGLFTSSLFVRNMSWMVPIRPPFIIIFVPFSFLHYYVCDC